MKIARHFSLLALLPAVACAEVLLQADFEAMPAGAPPVGATALNPLVPSETLSITVVEGAANGAGGGAGKGLQIIDRDPKGAILEYNLTGLATEQKSALRISFDLARQGESDGDPVALVFGLGGFAEAKGTLNAKANRFITGSFFTDGRFVFAAGQKGKSKAGQLGPVGARNRFVILVNDRESGAIPCKGPDGKSLSLAANSLVVFHNGRSVYQSSVDSLAGAEKQLGRIGFSTTSTPRGFHFTIDNLVTETLEP